MMPDLKQFLKPFKAKKDKVAAEPKIGKQGEDFAVRFLQANGYKILARNYRQRFGEIDIVAEDKDTLVFVEVKTRRNNRFGDPFEAVDTRKQGKLSRMAQDYISRNNYEDRNARFDVIAIYLSTDTRPDVHHIPNAFEFQEW